MTKNKKNIVDVEYGIDSRYKSKEERESDAAALMEARLNRIKNISKDQITKAKLLQLKLKMEEYLKNPVYDKHNYFSEFLKLYIDSIYSKRSSFAKDIDVTPVSLSQVINNHREPKDEFILKLMIHSEKVYENVCEFHKEIWYQVYYHEKICDTMSNQEQWRPEIEKHIRIREAI
jgi:plasmid maintenance system antidote protein VapI